MSDGYVYAVMTPENKLYIGMRYANQKVGINPEDDFGIEYFTSSDYVPRDLFDVCKRRILYTHSDHNVVAMMEIIIIASLIKSGNLLNKFIPTMGFRFYGAHSEETRRKISEARRGVKLGPVSDETKLKMSEAKRGKPKSEETRRKISEAKRGKPKSEETKLKMSEAKRPPHSEETKRKLSEAAKNRRASYKKKSKIEIIQSLNI